MNKAKSGISILEVVLAVAVFAIFGVPAIGAIVRGFSVNRLALEEVIATQFASEGIEAMRSIKNQSFSLVVDTTAAGVVRNGSNVWAFSGLNNTYAAPKTYTRILKVESVNRDGSGNIVPTPTGTVDSLTKRVTSTVTWSFSTGRPESVSLSAYLSDWKKRLSGIVLYGNSTTTPRYRVYDSSAIKFDSTASTIASISPLNVKVRTSPTKIEAIGGAVNSSGTLQVMCFDGASWTNEWSVAVGGTGTTRRFDIAYETSSGDVIVLYSTNTATNNELAYRTKLGSSGCGVANWSGATNITSARTNGIVQWVKLAGDRRSNSNLITAIWADAASDMSALVWSGSAWGNEPAAALETALEVVAAAQDVDSFDVEYESTSGNVMVVWGSGGNATTNGAYYGRCTGGTSTCTWVTKTALPTFANDATNLDLAANPNSNEMVFASIGNAGSDLQVGYWSGSTWTNTNDIDRSARAPTAGSSLVAAGFLVSGAPSRSVIVYADNTATTTSISYYTGNAGVFTSQSDFVPSPVPGVHRWYSIDTDPFDKDSLILVFSDANNDMFAKQLTMTSAGSFSWANADSAAALEASLGQAITNPFEFEYWRY